MRKRTFTWTLAAGGLALAACMVAPGSQGSQTSTPQPPQPMSMEPSLALGLWHSSFGAVKIEHDSASGGDGVMGVWVYDRDGEEIIGYFSGTLRGNVLEFTWNEPAQPQDLGGGGFLSFEPDGRRFSGHWWTDDQQRGGLWSGWRQDGEAPGNPSYGSAEAGAWDESEYGGNAYGGSNELDHDEMGGDDYDPPPQPYR